MQVAVNAILLTALMLMPQSSSNQSWVSIKQSSGQQVVLETVVPAQFGFRVEHGVAPATGLLRCMQHNERRSIGQVSYPVVLLECDGGVQMVMTEVDLTQ